MATLALQNVLTKSLRDRWRASVVAALIVGGFLVLGMWAYQSIDMSLYDDLPEAMRSVMGIPQGADPASLAYGVILGMIGAITIAGVAVSMGAASVAGEERDGTIGLLLGNPRSRRDVLLSKTMAMVALTTLAATVLLAASLLAPSIVGAEVGSAHIVAAHVHLWANAVLFGSFAVAISAVTGNRSLSSALPAGAMAVSYVAVGLLPLFEGARDAAKAVPWFWFDGHDPLVNGVAPGYLALQLASTSVLLAVAWYGVTRRDLRKPMSDGPFLARLAGHPLAARITRQLSGSSSISSITAKAASEGRALLLITAGLMFSSMGLLMGPMFKALEGTLATMAASLPDVMLAAIGGADMATPEGFYTAETFSIMAPVAIILVAVTRGAKALAGEERDRTMGLLLASPVSRSHVVRSKAVAMAVHAAVVGVAIFAGVVGGSLIAGLGMSVADIAAASAMATLLGLLFGSLALAIGGVTGQVRFATLGAVGAAGAAYAFDVVASIIGSEALWTRLSPFDWYLGSDPMTRGMPWLQAGIFVVLIALLVWVAVRAFDDRDLRRT